MSSTSPEGRAPSLAVRIERHRTLVGMVGAAIALALAVVWVFVVPEKADQSTGVQAWVIRWAHPLCWVLLAAGSLAYALRAPARARDGLLVAGGASYAAFLLALAL